MVVSGSRTWQAGRQDQSPSSTSFAPSFTYGGGALSAQAPLEAKEALNRARKEKWGRRDAAAREDGEWSDTSGEEEGGGVSDMPLLESVKFLVEKERALSSLKCEEAQAEAMSWKERYLELQDALKAVSLGKEAAGTMAQGMQEEPEVDIDPESHCLSLPRKGLGSMDAISLADKVKWMKRLTIVDLSHNNLTDECAGSLGELISLRLRSIDLSHNDLGPAAAFALFDGLSRSKTLERLALEGNLPMSSTSGMGNRIAEVLRGGPSQLKGFSVTLDDFARALCGKMETAAGTRERRVGLSLDAKRSASSKISGGASRRTKAPMNAQDFVKLLGASSLSHARGSSQKSSALVSLGIPHARLHKTSVAYVCDRLLKSLVYLDLSNCFLGPAGAVRLSKSLPKVDLLATLLLKGNAMGLMGGVALARALPGQVSLTHLDLRSNDLEDGAADALSASLGEGSTLLKLLDIAHNPISRPAGLRLLNAAVDRGVRVRACHRETLKGSAVLKAMVVVDMEEEVSQPAAHVSADRDGFVEMKRSLLLDDFPILEVSWASGRGGTGLHRWKIGRRRGGNGENMETALIGIGGESPDAQGGWEKFKVQARGWLKGDELSLWMAPCDKRGNYILPSHRQHAGKLRCKTFKATYQGDEGAVVWRDPVVLSDQDYEDGATISESHANLNSAHSIILMAQIPPTESIGVPKLVRQVPIVHSGQFRATFEARLHCSGLLLSSQARQNIARFGWAISIGERIVSRGFCCNPLAWKWTRIRAELPQTSMGEVLGLWVRPDVPPQVGTVIQSSTDVLIRSFSLFREDVVVDGEVCEPLQQQLEVCYDGPNWMHAGNNPDLSWAL